MVVAAGISIVSMALLPETYRRDVMPTGADAVEATR